MEWEAEVLGNKYGEVCRFCRYFDGCENANKIETYKCEDFRLKVIEECDYDCYDCYMFVLNRCERIKRLYEVIHEGKWVYLLNPLALETMKLPLIRKVYAYCPECGAQRLYTQHFSNTFVEWDNIADDAIVYINIPPHKSDSGKSLSGKFDNLDSEFVDYAYKKYIQIYRLPYGKAYELVRSGHALIRSAKLKADIVITLKNGYAPIIRRSFNSLCWTCARRIIMVNKTYEQGHLVLAKVNMPELQAIYMKVRNRSGNNKAKEIYNHEFSSDIQVFERENGDVFGILIAWKDYPIRSRDHDTITIDAGRYVVYHPSPNID